MALSKQNKTKVKKVIKGLNKASNLHAGQAKVLKGVLKKHAARNSNRKTK